MGILGSAKGVLKRFLNYAIKVGFVRKLITLRLASDSHLRKVYSFRNFYLNLTMQFYRVEEPRA